MAKKKTTIVKSITFKITHDSEGNSTTERKDIKGYTNVEVLGLLEILKQEVLRGINPIK